MATYRLGTELSADMQREVLRRFVHRFTRDHVPAWSRKPMPNGEAYKVQFRSDTEWLAHTEFAVTKTGKLDVRVAHCLSRPTFPDGH